MKKRKTVKLLLHELTYESKLWDGAASLSFYILFSIFPGLLVLASAASFVSYGDLSDEMTSWGLSYMPSGVKELVFSVIQDVSSGPQRGLLSIGFIVSIWTATSGVAAIIRELNKILKIKEKRNFMKIRLTAALISVLITFVFIFAFVILILGQLAKGYTTEYLGYDPDLIFFSSILRYSLAAIVFFVGFGTLYFLGPNRKMKLSEIWPGSLLSAVSFVASSYAYSIYLAKAGDYSTTYGSLGAAVGLLMWLYILSFFLLVGAELNYITSQKDKPLVENKKPPVS